MVQRSQLRRTVPKVILIVDAGMRELYETGWMHNIVQRAVVVEEKIEVRPIMYLALSYDHRIIDGKYSVVVVFTISISCCIEG